MAIYSQSVLKVPSYINRYFHIINLWLNMVSFMCAIVPVVCQEQSEGLIHFSYRIKISIHPCAQLQSLSVINLNMNLT